MGVACSKKRRDNKCLHNFSRQVWKEKATPEICGKDYFLLRGLLFETFCFTYVLTKNNIAYFRSMQLNSQSSVGELLSLRFLSAIRLHEGKFMAILAF
jgi:hypothetical protein